MEAFVSKQLKSKTNILLYYTHIYIMATLAQWCFHGGRRTVNTYWWFFFWYPFSSSFFDCHLTEYKTNNADHKIRLFSLWFGVSSLNNSIFSFHWLTINRFGLLSYFQLHRTHTSMSTLCMFWLQYQTLYVQESVVDVG